MSIDEDNLNKDIKMKIVICVDCLTNGGAERVAAMWVNGFKQRGDEVSVIVSNIRLPVTYTIPSDVPIFNIDYKIKNGYVRHLMKIIFQVRKMRKIFQAIRPDLVIAVIPSWGPLIYKAKGDMDFKVVGTDHSSYERPSNAPMTKKTKWLKFKFNKRFDAVTVLTQADKDVIGDRLSNVFVLPNPLAFKPVDDINEKKKIVLAMGRLDAGHYKGFDVLIKAFGMTSNDWSLQIAGGGRPESLEKYQKLAKECGVEKQVNFLGFVSNPITLFQRASIFVLSSRYEGFGLVLIEAMSQGCACIACDYKGRQREIISSDEQGLICMPDDVEGLASCLEKVMNDDNYRLRIQKKGIERSKDYQLEHIMQRWEVVLQSIGMGKDREE